MRNRFLLISLPLVMLLSGCLSVTPRGVAEMARFNPLHVNPDHLAAGLGVPETIRLADGNAMITMTYRLKANRSLAVNERFLLELSDSNSIPGAPADDDGEHIYVGQLSRLDALRMRDVQARILAIKSKGIEGEGTFSITLRGGCSTQLPVTSLPFRTFVRTRSGAAFVEVTRKSDFVSSLPRADRQTFLDSIGMCKNAG